MSFNVSNKTKFGSLVLTKFFFNILIVVTRNINKMKFISSTGGAENFFANVSIGYTQGTYYLSSSGLNRKVKKQAHDG